jgi:uncharacterized membrane protein
MRSINKLLILLLIFSFLGFVDASYLTVLHYKNIIPPCTITHGCEKVLSSSYAVIFGIALSAYGMAYFVVSIFANLLLFKYQKNVWLRRLYTLFNYSGLIAAFIFLWLQFIVIKSLCQYCLLTELILFILFYLSLLFLRRTKLA